MDTRQVSPAQRRRVGQPACSYSTADGEGVVHSTPLTTDWGLIESVFAAKTKVVSADHTGGTP